MKVTKFPLWRTLVSPLPTVRRCSLLFEGLANKVLTLVGVKFLEISITGPSPHASLEDHLYISDHIITTSSWIGNFCGDIVTHLEFALKFKGVRKSRSSK